MLERRNGSGNEDVRRDVASQASHAADAQEQDERDREWRAWLDLLAHCVGIEYRAVFEFIDTERRTIPDPYDEKSGCMTLSCE